MDPKVKREINLKAKLRQILKRYYPGFASEDLDEASTHVLAARGGTLVGLTYRKLFILMKPFLHKRAEVNKQIVKKERLDKLKMDATCPFCFSRFIEKFSRDRHIKLMHSDVGGDANNLLDDNESDTTRKVKTEKPEKCTKCDKMFRHKISLQRHMRVHEDTPESFPCGDCSKSFTRKDNMFKHRERVHNLTNVNVDAARERFKKDPVCPMCGEDFGEDHNLFEAHLIEKVCMNKKKNVDINKNLKFQCELCDKSYHHKDGLLRHIQWKHTANPKTFKCKDCDVSYTLKSSLVRHNKKHHEASS